MKKSATDKDLKFEQALRILEDIADRINNGQGELDEMLNLYEEGIDYLKICRQRLAEAELKVEMLTERMHKELGEEEGDGQPGDV